MKRELFEQGLASMIAERMLESRPWATFLDALRRNGWIDATEIDTLERQLEEQLERSIKAGEVARVAVESVVREAIRAVERALRERQNP
ncbi:MAG: hypothetical protein KC609_08960 [Myxococcales bacterium]|nr:hypothetical protein [Myxococcales bacterium]